MLGRRESDFVWRGRYLAFALAAVWLAGSAGAVAAEEIAVLSYNTHGLHRWISGGDPERRFPVIGARARAYDVVLLQEVFVDDYRRRLGFGVAPGWREIAGNGPRPGPLGLMSLCSACGAGLLAGVRPGIEVTAVEAVPFTLCAGKIRGAHDCWATKGLLFLRLRLAGGREVDVYDLHLDAGDRGADFRARRAQIGSLREALERYSQGRAVIVAGDFNLKDDVRRDRELLEAFRQGAGLLDSGARAAPHRWPELLDYILYRPGDGVPLTLLEAGEAVEMVDDQGRPLSDHPALFARFRLGS